MQGSIQQFRTRCSGITTFMNLPHTQDLSKAKAAIVGVPFDSGSCIRTGSRFGPNCIREQSKLYLRTVSRQCNLAVAEEIDMIDYGDTPLIPESIKMSFSLITEELTNVFSNDVIPIILGGDHSITLPCLRAAARRHGPLSLIHFDSHLDIVDSYYSGKIRYNSGTVFRRATEENLLDPSSSTQIGSNGSIFPEMQPSFSRQLGYQVINVEEALRMGPEALSSLIVDRVRNKKVYLSFDVDVMDVCVAPGSGAPEVGGFLTREVLQIVRQLNEVQFIGFDVVEVNPLFDCSNITSIFAANLAFEFMTLIALGRRKRPPIGKRY